MIMLQVTSIDGELHHINANMILWIKENKNPANKVKYKSKIKVGTQIFYSKHEVQKILKLIS